MPITYLAGKNATVTVGGNAMAVQDGQSERDAGADETTNTKSGGFYEAVATIKKWTLSVQAVYEGTNPPTFNEGDTVTCTLSIPSAHSVSGNIMINKITEQFMTVQGKAHYSFSATGQGAYTIANT